MSIIKRIKHLGLPLDQIVVIGSGLLDALELRTADDIDLVVTEKLFSQLSVEEDYTQHEREGEPYLTKDDVEIWMSWGNERQPNFQQLKDNGVVIDDVIFVNKDFLIAQKKQSGRDKDISDISLLKGV
jgi:hypothetical protein